MLMSITCIPFFLTSFTLVYNPAPIGHSHAALAGHTGARVGRQHLGRLHTPLAD